MNLVNVKVLELNRKTLCDVSLPNAWYSLRRGSKMTKTALLLMVGILIRTH